MPPKEKRSPFIIARDWVALSAAIFALCSGGYGAFQAFALIPLNQQRQEREIDTIKQQQKTDHEALIRIEDRVEFIKAILEKIQIAGKP